MKESVARVITAILGATIVVFATVIGGLWFYAIVAAVALVGQTELYKLSGLSGSKSYTIPGLSLGVLVLSRPYFEFWLEGCIVLVVVVLFWMTFNTVDDNPLARVGATFLGVLYPTTLLSFMGDVRLSIGLAIDDTTSMTLTLLILLLVWANDIFALYVGTSIGRRPFFPRISPKKTWEGYAGGLLASIGVGVAFALAVESILTWYDIASLVIICGAVAPFGDLVESRLKRSVEVKDSGNLLPGHGGILDRIDSLLVGGALSWAYLVMRFAG